MSDTRRERIFCYLCLKFGPDIGIGPDPGMYFSTGVKDPFAVKMVDGHGSRNQFGCGQGSHGHRPPQRCRHGNVGQLIGVDAIDFRHSKKDILFVVPMPHGSGPNPTHGQLQKAGHAGLIQPQHPGPGTIDAPFQGGLGGFGVIRGLGDTRGGGHQSFHVVDNPRH